MAVVFSNSEMWLKLCTYLDPAAAFIESFSWMGESTYVFKFAALNDKLLPISEAVSMDFGLVKLIVGLFLSYPLGFGMRLMPNATLKHFYSFFVGLLMLQFVFGPSWIHTFISSFATYLICMFVPKKYLTSTAFLFVMGYMTIAHCYRMYVSYMSGILDFTGTQMVMTMKLTSFAFNYFDGVHDYQNVFIKEHASPSTQRMYADRRRFAIRELPSLLEYFGYMFCFTCILTGPAFEYSDYVSAIDGTAFAKKDKLVKVDDKEVLVSSIFASARRLVVALISMVLYLKVGPIVGIKYMYDPEFIGSHSHMFNLIFSCFSIGFDKMKYYFAWKLAEASCILAGFGFEGYDESGKIIGWKGVENIDILNFELGSNCQARTRYWNKRTQGWLERYVYNRTNKSLAITYFISAFWHGLYPGYFLFFLSLPLLTNIERLARSKLNPIFAPSYDGKDFSTYPRTFVGAVYWIVCYINTSITLHYVGEPFYVLTWERAKVFWGSFHYTPHLVFFLVYVALELFPSPKRKTDGSKAAVAKKAD